MAGKPEAKRKTTKHLTKAYFSNDQEVWEFLTRKVNGKQRFTRKQVGDVAFAMNTGWAIARRLQAILACLDLREGLPRLAPRIEDLPAGKVLRDSGLRRMVGAARGLENLTADVSQMLAQASALEAAADRVAVALTARPQLRRGLRSLAGEVQVMCAFAVRTAEVIGAAEIEPAEMEAFITLAGLRDRPGHVEFGPSAAPRRRRRDAWKKMFRKVPEVLASIDSLGSGDPT